MDFGRDSLGIGNNKVYENRDQSGRMVKVSSQYLLFINKNIKKLEVY